MNRWRILAIVAAVGTLFWWANAIITKLYPPFESAASIALWIVASACKLITILGLAWVIGQVAPHCYRNRRNAVTAAGVWAATGLLLLSALTLFRSPVTHVLDNDGARFFPTSVLKVDTGGFRAADDYPKCVRRWQSGQVLGEEVGVILLCSTILGFLGFTFGNRGTKAGAVGLLCLGAVAIFLVPALGLMSWDYDFFVCGTMIGPLFMEAIWPFTAISLPSEIGFLVYLGIIASSWILCRRLAPSSAPAQVTAS